MSNLLRIFINNTNSVLQTQQSIRFLSRQPLAITLRGILSPKQSLKYSSLKGQQQRSGFCTRVYDVNTNVTKDVILYKYENPTFFKIVNIFALSQFGFWVYLSHMAYTTLRDVPVDENKNPEELAWYEKVNLGESKYRNGITIACFGVGYCILFAAWTFTLRSVRFLILRKGGRDLSFVTYTPFGENRIMTVPVKNISAQQPRESAISLLPLKIRNRSLFYVLDMKGEFKNPQLYDYTAGLHRKF